jgi:hypothetical protein
VTDCQQPINTRHQPSSEMSRMGHKRATLRVGSASRCPLYVQQRPNSERGQKTTFGMLMDGRSQMTGVRKRGQDAALLLVINGFHDVVEFIVPEWLEGAAWKLLIDTNVTHASVEKQIEFGNTYQVTGQSLLLLLLQTA